MIFYIELIAAVFAGIIIGAVIDWLINRNREEILDGGL